MNINKYLKVLGISQDRASKLLDITASYMNQICLGNKAPSRKLAKKIQDWSNGNVTIEDLIPEKKICPCCGRKLLSTKKSQQEQEEKESDNAKNDLQKVENVA